MEIDNGNQQSTIFKTRRIRTQTSHRGTQIEL